ncbi:hypothetical protein [Methylomagnum sp.]
MKPKFTSLFAGALLALASASPSVHAADAACGVHNLSGNYEFSATGKAVPAGSGYELRAVTVTGSLQADGAGNASLQRTLVTEGLSATSDQATGTYTVNPDCTGKLSLAADSYDFQLGQDGKLRFVGTLGQGVIAGTAWATTDTTSLSSAALVGCGPPLCPAHKMKDPNTGACTIPC